MTLFFFSLTVTYDYPFTSDTHMSKFLDYSTDAVLQENTSDAFYEIQYNLSQLNGIIDTPCLNVSNEDMSDQVLAIFRALSAALKSIWSNTARFLSAMFGSVARMRFHTKRLLEKLEDNNNNTHLWASTLNLEQEIGILSVDDKLPRYPIDIIRMLDNLLLLSDFYLNEYATIGNGVLKNLVYETENFNEDDPALSLNELNAEVAFLVSRNTPPAFKLTTVSDRRFIGQVWKVCNLPTDKSLFVSRTAVLDSSNPIARAESIIANTLTFTDTKELHKTRVSQSGTINTPTLGEMKQMCTLVLNLCDKIENYEKIYDEICINKDKLLDNTEFLVKRLSVGEIPSTDIPYYKTAIRYNSYITASLIQTCTTVSAMVMKVNRSILVIGNRALASSE